MNITSYVARNVADADNIHEMMIVSPKYEYIHEMRIISAELGYFKHEMRIFHERRLYQRRNIIQINKGNLWQSQGIEGPCRKFEEKVELCTEGG